MARNILFALAVAQVGVVAPSSLSAQDLSPFVGRWAFSLPDGNPAWLRVNDDFTATMLWSVGSARPLTEVKLMGDRLSFVRQFAWRPYGGKDVYRVTRPIVGQLNQSGQLVLTVRQSFHGSDEPLYLKGKRMPPMPPAPDLQKISFGAPVDLLANGLEGWRLTNPKKKNGWRCEAGVLINETPKTDFGAYGEYGNLRTKRDFMDFELSIEYNVAAGGNSGIYLRGAYEVQVVDRDSRMQGIQGPGAVFGRIAPTENAGKPGGQWNHYRLLLVDRHITVELNGKRVIDNAPLEGCTGGGTNSDDTAPGPVFLQGDHTAVKYRNIVLRPASVVPLSER